MLAGKKLAVVLILRAISRYGKWYSGTRSVRKGHQTLHATRQPMSRTNTTASCQLLIELRTIVVTDPMLATGGSAVEAIDFIKARGGKNIKFMAIIAAPEGLKRLYEAHPDVQIYVGHHRSLPE